MRKVIDERVLADTYNKVLGNINRLPTQLLHPGQVIYRSVSPYAAHSLIEKPKNGAHLSHSQVAPLITPLPVFSEYNRENRFSGPSFATKQGAETNGKNVWSVSGVYFSIQPQALANEVMHYKKKPLFGEQVFDGRAILEAKLRSSMLVADLSPHNPGALTFLRAIGKDIYEQMQDPFDCSVARGIGLAVARAGFQGLDVETARRSERSVEEKGDNLVIFGTSNHTLSMLQVQSVRLFDRYNKTVEDIPVDWA